MKPLLSMEERLRVLTNLRRQCIELQDELNHSRTTVMRTTTAVIELTGVLKEVIFQLERLMEQRDSMEKPRSRADGLGGS